MIENTIDHNLCNNCGKEIIKRTLKDGSFSKIKKLYCNNACKETFLEKKYRYRRTNLKEILNNDVELEKYNRKLVENKKEYSKRSKSKVREWLINYKLEKGCIDCGYKEHYSALQLDHEGPKSCAIADAKSSISRLQKEIIDGKCVVRCANCHAVITWKRRKEQSK